MTDRLDLLNDILDALGEPRAASATITSSTAEWIKRAERQIDRSAKLIAESHPWNWMNAIEQLAQTGTAEPIGWEFEFTKPANALRIAKVTDDGAYDSIPIPFEDRSGLILTNCETTYLHFVDQARLDSMGSWPEHFALAVTLEAAWRASKGTEQSQNRRDGLETDKRKALAEAKTWDGQQQGAKPRYPGAFVRAVSGGWKSRVND